MAGLRRRIGRLERGMRAPLTSKGAGRPLTGEELAGCLGVTGETVRRWAGQGMPTCGAHPSRPSWPIYDESACRLWAAANQPQTELRPAAVGAQPVGGSSGGEESRAALRARRLHLQCQLMRLRLVQERDELIDADEARAVWRRHAEVVREKLGGLPAQMAEDLVGAFGLGEGMEDRFTAILAAEMARVLDIVSEDPLADAVESAETERRPQHPPCTAPSQAAKKEEMSKESIWPLAS